MGRSNFRPTKRSDGSVLATSAENMDAFDALPSVLQHELRYSILDIGCPHLLVALEWDDDVSSLLAALRTSEGRTGRARPIDRIHPAKSSIQDRRARRLAMRRMQMLERSSQRRM